jgi:pimeloyl-ACP methyl ester carboxylesterase
VERLVGPNGLQMERGGTPDGPPVVFVHGVMDRGAAFLRTTRLLPDTDWWVYDRRGYGRSLDAGTTDFEGHIGDVVAVLEVVVEISGRRPVLLGHSLGGALVLIAASRRPDLVAAVVTFEAPLSWKPWWVVRQPLLDPVDPDPELEAERFLRLMLGDERWERLPLAAREKRLLEGPAYVAEVTSVRDFEGLVAAEIEVPVVLAHGTSEHAAQPSRVADELLVDLPRGQRVVVDGAPHAGHLTHPAALADVVRLALTEAAAFGSDGRLAS